MDAGTTVALVLGIVGFISGGLTLGLNRHDARQQRWLHDKRLIYVSTHAALSNLLDTEIALRSGSDDEREAAREANDRALMHMNDVHADLDLLAPDAVRDAVFAADEALYEIGTTLVIGGVPTHPDPIGAATEACRAALNAMRSDLGIGPVREWRTPIED